MFAEHEAGGQLFGSSGKVLTSLGSVNPVEPNLDLLCAHENGDGVPVCDAHALGGEVLGRKEACTQEDDWDQPYRPDLDVLTMPDIGHFRISSRSCLISSLNCESSSVMPSSSTNQDATKAVKVPNRATPTIIELSLRESGLDWVPALPIF